MAWGTGTKPVDDEGVPTLNKTLVSKGILNGYLYNTYTAKKRRGLFNGQCCEGIQEPAWCRCDKSLFKNLMGDQKSAVRSQNGTNNNTLLKSMSRGILILGAMGVHTANPISGDFFRRDLGTMD